MLGTSTAASLRSGAGDVEERHALTSCDDADPMALPVVAALAPIPTSTSLVLLPKWLAAFSLSVAPVSVALNGCCQLGDSGGSAGPRTGLEGCWGHGSSVQLMLLLTHPGLNLFPGCKMAQQLERHAEVSPKCLRQAAFHSEATRKLHEIHWSTKGYRFCH